MKSSAWSVKFLSDRQSVSETQTDGHTQCDELSSRRASSHPASDCIALPASASTGCCHSCGFTAAYQLRMLDGHSKIHPHWFCFKTAYCKASVVTRVIQWTASLYSCSQTVGTRAQNLWAYLRAPSNQTGYLIVIPLPEVQDELTNEWEDQRRRQTLGHI